MPGGGVALLRAGVEALSKLKAEDPDEQTGINIVRRAIEEPARLIAENAGAEGSVVVEKILTEKNVNYGYDAEKGEFVDMMKAGIVDPAKVVRTALENAASIAGYLLTSDVIITEIPEKKEKSSPPMPEY